jgi:hypothetical protein
LGSGLKKTWIDKDTCTFLLTQWVVACHKLSLVSVYKNTGKEVITVESTVWGGPVLYSNSVEVLRQVAGGGNPSAWYKPRWYVPSRHDS